MSQNNKKKEAWTTGIMPKTDTQAADFLKSFNPMMVEVTVVGILDTGVDPECEGFCKLHLMVRKKLWKLSGCNWFR